MTRTENKQIKFHMVTMENAEQDGKTGGDVSSCFNEQAKEDMVAKVKRLILNDSGQ